MMTLVFQREQSCPLLSSAEAMLLKPSPIPMPNGTCYSMRRGRGDL